MRLRIGCAAWLLAYWLRVNAQVPAVEPGYFDRPQKGTTVKAAPPRAPGLEAGLPAPLEVALAPLTESERTAAPGNTTPPVVGIHRPLPEPIPGAWETLSTRRWVWRVALRSPGAVGVRFHFVDFDAGAGRVWIHDNRPSEPQVFGPYTGRGIHGDGDFWSDVVFGESVVVEYEPGSEPRAVPFRIAEIAHLWDQIGPVRQAASCHLDLSCHAEWAESAKGVAHIVYEKEGSSFVCSGSLLATRNRTGTPYFLTAAHCFDNDTVARTVEAFWFYQTGSCNGPPPSRASAPRTLGARYVAGKPMQEGDATLVRFVAAPPNGVLFLGWEASDPPVGSPMVGIHHPRGDFKRISLGARDPDGSLGLPPAYFFKVRWNSGATEGGSSGSPVFSRPGVVAGQLSHGPRVPAGQTACDVERFDFYGRLSVSYPALREYLEERAPAGASGGETPPPPPSGNPTALVSGQAAEFSLPAVTGATLIRPGYRIDVPAGASRLEVRLVTTTPGVDLDLYVRFGQEVTISAGRPEADYSSTGAGGTETVIVAPQSALPLRAGTYYINLAIFTAGAAASGTLTATVDTAAPPPTGGTVLRSGVAVRWSLPAVQSRTLFSPAFRIDVPAGAARLEIRLLTTTPGADVDLYARYGQEPTVAGGNVVFDYSSTGESGDELILIGSGSNPPLRPGAYYISLALFSTGLAAEGTLTATVESSAAASARLPATLTSGQPANFTLPAVSTPTLMSRAGAFRIVVPDGATKLEVRLVTSPAAADTDLFVRFGGEPDLAGGQVVADYSSIGDTGVETITITAGSTPPLLPGTYYLTVGLYSTGMAASGTLTATVERAATTAPSSATRLNSGAAADFSLPAVSVSTLFTGASAFRIDVPQGATRLEVRVNTTTANADLDLYVRFGAEPAVLDGRVTADFRATSESGSETIVITPASSPPLQAGSYFIGLVLFTTGLAARGTVTAAVSGAGGGAPTLASVVHGASFRTGPIAAGEIVSLFGQSLGPPAGAPAQLNGAGRLETRVDDTVATFDGVAAPLFYISPGQINAQAPYSLEGRSSTQVRVIRKGLMSNTLSIPVAAAAPALFTYPDGSNRLIALNQDGSLNSPSNPAAPGSIVILFGTGEGSTSPAGAEGVPAADPFPRPVRAVTLQVAGRTAEVLYAGAAPGFVGLLQINTRVPAGLAASDRAAVSLTIGNASSPAGTHLAVR
jgi:uncharacterized protein (TIGR03437 family)